MNPRPEWLRELILFTRANDQPHESLIQIAECPDHELGASVRCIGVGVNIGRGASYFEFPVLTCSFMVRPSGFEPETCGLRVRCSAVELEAQGRV
jgi:hypothetical protein